MKSHVQSSHIQPLDLESLGVDEAGTEAQPLLSCEPLNLSRLEVGLVKPGTSRPGLSDDDQLYVLLRGGVKVSSSRGDRQLTEPGSVLYQPAQTECLIDDLGNVSAITLRVKLMGARRQKLEGSLMEPAIACPSEAIAQHGSDVEGKTLAFDGETSSLKRLHCFFLTLEAGDAVPVHQHRDHGVLMLGLAGDIELEGNRLNSPSLMYYRGGEPHGFEVLDDGGFRGLAIEFYRDPPLSEKLRSLARNTKNRLRP